MDVKELQRMFIDYKAYLVKEGFLNNAFNQLQELQEDGNPNFVFKMVTLFFEQCAKLFNGIDKALAQQTVDFETMDFHSYNLISSSSCIGAQRFRDASVAFRKFCIKHDAEECARCLGTVKEESAILKTKLEQLLLLEKQILEAGGSVPKE